MSLNYASTQPTSQDQPNAAPRPRKEIHAMLLKITRVLDVAASIAIVVLAVGAASFTATLGL